MQTDFKELKIMLPQTPEQLEHIRQDCRKLLHKRAALSAAAAVIPLPGADISADIAIMAELLTTINARFGLTPDQVSHLDLERKRILIVLITSAGNEFIGKTITARMVRTTLRHTGRRLLTRQGGKWVPIAGIALSASVSYGAMYYLGAHHIQQCYDVVYQYLHHVDTRWLGDVIEISGQTTM